MKPAAQPLSELCAELAESWINGNRKEVLERLTKCFAGKPFKYPSPQLAAALTAGTLRHLAGGYGDDAASDLATALTKPYGGHYR